MLAETTSWFCDQCGQLIKCAADGWVEWLRLRGRVPGRGMRIVHRFGRGPYPGGCLYQLTAASACGLDVSISDDALEMFRGRRGRARLRHLQEDDRVQADELAEVIDRIHTPGYEHARRAAGRPRTFT